MSVQLTLMHRVVKITEYILNIKTIIAADKQPKLTNSKDLNLKRMPINDQVVQG